MKTISSVFLGVLSTVFLAAGLFRAADRVDPIRAKASVGAGRLIAPEPCNDPCNLITGSFDLPRRQG